MKALYTKYSQFLQALRRATFILSLNKDFNYSSVIRFIERHKQLIHFILKEKIEIILIT